jgi:hypothetical protein
MKLFEGMGKKLSTDKDIFLLPYWLFYAKFRIQMFQMSVHATSVKLFNHDCYAHANESVRNSCKKAHTTTVL